MKFFIDTEFIERGREFPIQLISIGIVCENSIELYAESSDYDPSTASEWVKENVFPHLVGHGFRVSEIASYVEKFVDFHSQGSKPEFWGYYADYDWVVFCQMFGSMVDLPKGWPMYCRDLKQWCDDLGNPKLTKPVGEHNALADARWNKSVYEFLQTVKTATDIK